MFCTMQTYSTPLTLVIVTSLFLFTTQGSSSNAVEPTKKPLKLANYRATCEDRTRTLVTRLNTSHHSVVWQRYDIYSRYMRRMPPLCIITDAYKETTHQGGATFTCTRQNLTLYNLTIKDTGVYLLQDQYTGDVEAFYLIIHPRSFCRALETRRCFYPGPGRVVVTDSQEADRAIISDLKRQWSSLSLHCAWVSGLMIFVGALVICFLRSQRIGEQDAERLRTDLDTEPLLLTVDGNLE